MAENILQFVQRWQGKGDEKSDTHTFWLELLHDVLDVEKPGELIDFEKRVELSHVSYIDAYIPSTKIIIEQKSLGVDLTLPAKQSDGSAMTPYEQAKRYKDWLPSSEQGRFIITCDFQTFRIHDLEYPRDEPEIIALSDLPEEVERLRFLVSISAKTPREIREQLLSENAGKMIRKFYNAVKPRYTNPDNPRSKRSLNILCTRLVFLLYAEDSGIFAKSAFHDYMAARYSTARDSLIKLFDVLNVKPEDRDPYLDDDLSAFPYVNGGLFEEKDIEIPRLDVPDDEPLRIMLEELSGGFNWASINPTIFGAIFESTLNDVTRDEGGMHYTSIENIHKVIYPLFMDGLNTKFSDIMKGSDINRKLSAFQGELASLTFLDPACGSGNFLTESYMSLRKLENKIIAALSKGQKNFAEGLLTPIKVSISQFYGIEINDFAVSVARTALWIAEHQMRLETMKVVEIKDDYLPLRTKGNITEANAILTDWASVIPRDKLDYIMGNPPFTGHQWRTEKQNDDMKAAFYDLDDYGKFDYVCAWYNRAIDFIRGTEIKAAFVSTNSIIQGELQNVFWKFIRSKGFSPFMAYRPFMWESKAENKAHVHCIILGFTVGHEVTPKYIYNPDGTRETVSQINGWLRDAPDVYLSNRGGPIRKGLPRMRKGSQPTDGGNLILSSSEREELLAKYPETVEFIRRYMGGRDFLHNEVRYCLWLVGVEPGKFRHIRPIMERLKLVSEVRRKSSTKSVREAADTPALFTQIRQPESGHFLILSEVSSSLRQYIPMGYATPDVIISNTLQIIPNAGLFMFGVMISRVHVAWVDVVCGRLEIDYRYTPFVYNNFPWPDASDVQRVRIERTAQGILDARAMYPESCLADLYDPLAMPQELRKAHRENDRAVMEAYGWGKEMDEVSVVNELMRRYEEISGGE